MKCAACDDHERRRDRPHAGRASMFLHQQRQSPESAPHVGVAGRKPNPYIARDRNHRRSSTSRTRAKAAASTLASTRTRLPPPRLISINPLGRAAARDWVSSSDTASKSPPAYQVR